jgi:hypothetical protein
VEMIKVANLQRLLLPEKKGAARIANSSSACRTRVLLPEGLR